MKPIAIISTTVHMYTQYYRPIERRYPNSQSPVGYPDLASKIALSAQNPTGKKPPARVSQQIQAYFSSESSTMAKAALRHFPVTKREVAKRPSNLKAVRMERMDGWMDG